MFYHVYDICILTLCMYTLSYHERPRQPPALDPSAPPAAARLRATRATGQRRPPERALSFVRLARVYQRLFHRLVCPTSTTVTANEYRSYYRCVVTTCVCYISHMRILKHCSNNKSYTRVFVTRVCNIGPYYIRVFVTSICQ